MSLIVWLPLNGDLHNQGLSNITVTNNGATIDNNGKIGSCYTFNGSNSFVSLSGSSLNSIFKGGSYPFSISFWIYHADSTRAIIFGDYNLSGSISFNIELTTSHTVRFYWDNSPDKTFTDSSVGVNTWTHICFTYSGSKVSIYKNGSLLSDSYSSALGSLSKTSGSFYLGRDNRTGATALNGKINDFRIYDHCLSPKEVKEISKGLILHYPLNKVYTQLSNGNVMLNLPNGLEFYEYLQNDTSSWIDTEVIPSSNTNFELEMSWNSLASSEEICFGCSTAALFNNGYNFAVLRGGDKKIYPSFRKGYNSVNVTISIGTKYTFKLNGNTFSVNTTSSTLTRQSPPNLSIYLFARNLNNTHGQILDAKKLYYCKIYESDRLIRHFLPCSYNNVPGMWDAVEGKFYGNSGTGTFTLGSKLTKSAMPIYDCSGYEHHGTITGNLQINNNSPRYNYYTTLTNNDDYIQINEDFFNLTQPFTISCWCNFDGSANQFVLNISDANHNRSFNFGSNSGSMNQTIIFTGTTYSGVQAGTIKKGWSHYVMLYNGTKLDLYRDGVLLYSQNRTNISYSYNITTNYIRISRASICDVRIYTTSLSDADILELYNNPTNIDNQGNMFTFEFDEEETSKQQILKTGITNIDNFIEISDKIKVLADGSVFLQILHHNNPASNLFTTLNCWQNNTTNLYSALILLKTIFRNQSEYEFLACEKAESSTNSETQFRWSQTSNPALSSTITGRTIISGSVTHNEGLKTNGSNAAIHNGNGWWCACGSYTTFQGGIPGFNSVIKSGYMDLYIRIPEDVLKGEIGDNLKFFTKSILSTQFLEK